MPPLIRILDRGAATFLVAHLLGVAGLWAGLAGFACAFAIRAGAIQFGWSLPAFPGRGRRDGD